VDVEVEGGDLGGGARMSVWGLWKWVFGVGTAEGGSIGRIRRIRRTQVREVQTVSEFRWAWMRVRVLGLGRRLGNP
jgi:hypothetical protein